MTSVVIIVCMGKKTQGGGSSIGRLFVKAAVEGVKSKLKSFVGASGFIAALGFVYAANEGYHHVFGAKPTTEMTDVMDPGNPDAARDPASADVPNSDHQKVNPGLGDATAGDSDPPSAETAGAEGAVSETKTTTKTNRTGYVPNLPQNNGAPPSAAQPPKTANNTPNPDSPSVSSEGGNFASPTPAQDGNTPGSGTTVSSNTATTIKLSGGSGSQITAGSVFGTGSFLQVQATVGEVASPNYVQNSEFTLISGVAGLVSGD
jgi:hypothetical protein